MNDTECFVFHDQKQRKEKQVYSTSVYNRARIRS